MRKSKLLPRTTQALLVLPHEVAKDPAVQANGLNTADMEAAMRRLFGQGKIRLEEYTGIDGRPAVRIVEAP
jgi:hypothetical protein